MEYAGHQQLGIKSYHDVPQYTSRSITVRDCQCLLMSEDETGYNRPYCITLSLSFSRGPPNSLRWEDTSAGKSGMILIWLPSKESGLWLRASRSISVSTVSWCILAIITHGLCFTMGPMRWARSTFMPRGKLASPKSEGNRPETNCVGLPFSMFSGRPAILIICPQDLASKSVTLDFRDAFSCDKLEQSCSRWEMRRL